MTWPYCKCDHCRLQEAAPDLLAVALGYEAWEADLIMNNGWNGKDGLPTLTGPQYDEMMRLQALRNGALGKALCRDKETSLDCLGPPKAR